VFDRPLIVNTAGRVLQTIDLVVDQLEVCVDPVRIECFDLGEKPWYISAFSDNNFQDAVIYGGRAKECVVEVKTCDPLTIGAHVAGCYPTGALRNGRNVNGVAPIFEQMMLRLNQCVDGAEEVIYGPGEVRVAPIAGTASSSRILRANPDNARKGGSLRSRARAG
jgi:hypothetical protein